NLHATTAAILRDNKNDYSVGLAEFFRKEFTNLGGKILAEQSYSGGDSDFRPQLTAIKGTKPDVLFIPGFYTEVGQIAIQARDLGINIPMVCGDGWDSPTVIQIGGKSVDGCYLSDHYLMGEQHPAVKRCLAERNNRTAKGRE